MNNKLLEAADLIAQVARLGWHEDGTIVEPESHYELQTMAARLLEISYRNAEYLKYRMAEKAGIDYKPRFPS